MILIIWYFIYPTHGLVALLGYWCSRPPGRIHWCRSNRGPCWQSLVSGLHDAHRHIQGDPMGYLGTSLVLIMLQVLTYKSLDSDSKFLSIENSPHLLTLKHFSQQSSPSSAALAVARRRESTKRTFFILEKLVSERLKSYWQVFDWALVP